MTSRHTRKSIYSIAFCGAEVNKTRAIRPFYTSLKEL
uniref:Uncharacterized protein n=1 Tax=Podoviridae sp. ctZ5d16 TaxID=2825257 RepID=A0A8S5Q843_9CAUD|nr:MAG TPA: hypothetical protein [Podoviridae sp. ctZ5d16]